MEDEPPEADPEQLTEQEVKDLVNESLNEFLKPYAYVQNMLDKWATHVAEDVIEKLSQLKKPYKYIVDVDLSQHCGSGRHAVFCSFWDTEGDDFSVIHWNNKTLTCSVTVFYLPI